MHHVNSALKRIGNSHLILFFILIFLSLQNLKAEPWLANRYAQNCASCHSPSRRNVEPIDRRCTLACQGCHVNPSGGGIRNEYGVWTQQRWLRSFKSETFNSKGTPAPLKYQKYGKASSKKDWRDMAQNGPVLVVIPGVDYRESSYDKRDKQEHIVVRSRAEFLARLTEDDPYRVERSQNFFASGDFRYFFLNDKSTVPGQADRKYSGSLPMAFDLGVRARPTREHAQFVFETRYYQTPNSNQKQSSPETIFTASAQVRSAYLFIDDLPWNSYFQYGLYKPMFGYTTPDHTTLLNTLLFADNTTGTDHYRINADSSKAVYRALSVGGSPNVPFYNFHLIMPTAQRFGANKFSQDKGIAANLGARFVTLGASGMLSFWSTKGPRTEGGPDLKSTMLGFNGGFAFKNLIFNLDYTKIERQFSTGTAIGSDSGVVSTIDAKFRIPYLRETYLQGIYAASTTTRKLKAGNAAESMVGLKTFLLSGIEFEVLAVNRTDTVSGQSAVKSTGMQTQLHLFF